MASLSSSSSMNRFDLCSVSLSVCVLFILRSSRSFDLYHKALIKAVMAILSGTFTRDTIVLNLPVKFLRDSVSSWERV